MTVHCNGNASAMAGVGGEVLQLNALLTRRRVLCDGKRSWKLRRGRSIAWRGTRACSLISSIADCRNGRTGRRNAGRCGILGATVSSDVVPHAVLHRTGVSGAMGAVSVVAQRWCTCRPLGLRRDQSVHGCASLLSQPRRKRLLSRPTDQSVQCKADQSPIKRFQCVTSGWVTHLVGVPEHRCCVVICLPATHWLGRAARLWICLAVPCSARQIRKAT